MASFLYRVFVVPNLRSISQPDLAEALEDELFALRERLGPDAFPKPALDYLNDWAANEKGWLRKFYRQGSDEPQFDLTAASAYNSELVKQKLKIMRTLGLSGAIEDMLITLTDQIHLIKLVGPNTFLYLAVDKKQSNLAMVRSAVNKHASALM